MLNKVPLIQPQRHLLRQDVVNLLAEGHLLRQVQTSQEVCLAVPQGVLLLRGGVPLGGRGGEVRLGRWGWGEGDGGRQELQFRMLDEAPRGN